MTETETTPGPEDAPKSELYFYRIRFRMDGQEFTAESEDDGFIKGDVIMAKTDHGLEPAIIIGAAPVAVNFRKKEVLVMNLPGA